MIDRKKLLHPQSLRNFQLRGGQGHRLEALSDGVFALAIAILLIASSVPRNYAELLEFVYDAFPLLICMVFIYWIWFEQTVFFMRYGLYNTKIIRLNLLLLFLTLFYAYPLKFLMSWLIKFFFLFIKVLITGDEAIWQSIRGLSEIISFNNLHQLMIIYSGGFFGIFFVLFLMYRHAFSLRESLELSPIEIVETKFSLKTIRLTLLVAGISILIASTGFFINLVVASFFAGFVYNLLWIFRIPLVKQYNKAIAEFVKPEAD